MATCGSVPNRVTSLPPCRVVFSNPLPQRVSNVLGVALIGFVTISLVNGVVARRALDAADAAWLQLDALIDEGIEQPIHPLASGAPESLVAWDSIGRQGKNFIVSGPLAP